VDYGGENIFSTAISTGLSTSKISINPSFFEFSTHCGKSGIHPVEKAVDNKKCCIRKNNGYYLLFTNI
jgi:hypothetical protein